LASRLKGDIGKMPVKDEIETRLIAAFAPQQLEIVNESHKHAGHSGDDGTGESHFRIVIRAKALAEMGRVARHRAVQGALGDINTRVHAIALDIG
jgi:BolA family transcriptional regulator, general stress-responsive regulator